MLGARHSHTKNVTYDSLGQRLDAAEVEYTNNRQQDQLKIAKVEKELNNYKSVMSQVNINQEATQKATGYGIVSLPPNAAEGQVSGVVRGETLTSYIDETKLPTEDIVLHRTNRRTYNIAKPFKMIPGQIYTIFINVKDVSSEGIFRLNFKAYWSDAAWTLNKGINKRVITAGSDTTLNQLYFYILESAGENETATIDPTILVLEGDWTNKPMPPFFRGTKSTVGAFRIKSVSEDESQESVVYVLAKDDEGNIEELRSLPNGVKDEISFIDNKLIKRVSDEIVVDNSFNWVLETQRQNVDCVLIENVIKDNYNMRSIDNNFARISLGWSQRESEHTAVGFEIPETDIYKFAVTTAGNLRLIVPKGKYATLVDAKADLAGMTLIYQLAEPVEIPVQVSGNLISYPSGTIYVEPFVADAGVYTDKIEVLHDDLPIKAIEKVSKMDFMTGVETELDINQAEISEDKLSFTHPDLSEGDIVFFEYEYDLESTQGETEIEYYDSRYVIKDSVTDKFYKWYIVVANGQPSIELVEV